MINEDIKSQINRTKELLGDLGAAYRADFRLRAISDETRNLVQEILTKLRNILDQSMFSFFEKEIAPSLSKEKHNKARIYYPLALDINAIKSTLGRAFMPNLEHTHPKLHNFLLKHPLFKDSELQNFVRYSDMKHTNLIPHEKKENNETIIPGIIRASKKASGLTLINGRVIRNGKEIPLPNTLDLNESSIDQYDPRLNAKPWLTICFENTDIDIYDFCRRMIDKVEKTAFDFFALF